MAKYSRAIGMLFGLSLATQALAEEVPLDIRCLDRGDPRANLSTGEMIALLSEFSNRWDRPDGFAVGAVGGFDRVFNGSGRLLHPTELAELIRSAPSFSGERANAVTIAASFSDDASSSDSYVGRVAQELGVPVSGCVGVAYLTANGSYLCSVGAEAEQQEPTTVIERYLPFGFNLSGEDLFVAFCVGENEVADPHSIISDRTAFGLSPGEFSNLTEQAEQDADAAFRLYSYYWISARDRDAALDWLRKAAELGLSVARYNLAYEMLETGNAAQAATLLEQTPEVGVSSPDIRQFFEENVDTDQ